MDEPILVVISLTMFVGSYLAGCIPLFFNLNERRIRVVSIFGAGLLVGTALCIIIPEGVSTLIESSQPHHKHAENAVKPVLQFESAEMHRAEQQQQPKGKEPLAPLDAQKRHVEGSVEPKEFEESADEKFDGGVESAKRQRRLVKREIAAKPEGGDGGKNGGRHSDAAPPNLDGTIGVSLLVGFLFMFVVDQLAKLSHNRSKSLSTLGLVIHAFADGIAMGSASTAGTQLEMQILVFVAIMLHKAPAAFALVSILLAHGLEKTRIRRHLLIFSLAAPIGTILTYAFLHMATQANVPADGSQEAAPSHFTGIILLFSAGTFLYIATVHVLPELIDSKCSSNSSSTREMMTGSRELLLGGHASGLAGPISRLSLSEICLFCVSALLPAFISLATHGEHGH